MEDKECQRNLQAQLEMAYEQKKSLDLVGVNKRLEDYKQMLQYYTLMRMKNKMDSKVEFEEWWEVAKEYFTKELEKILAQHKADEKILKYKLKAYQKNFPDFIYASPTSIEVLGQDEENEARLSGTTQEEEVKTKKP